MKDIWTSHFTGNFAADQVKSLTFWILKLIWWQMETGVLSTPQPMHGNLIYIYIAACNLPTAGNKPVQYRLSHQQHTQLRPSYSSPLSWHKQPRSLSFTTFKQQETPYQTRLNKYNVLNSTVPYTFTIIVYLISIIEIQHDAHITAPKQHESDLTSFILKRMRQGQVAGSMPPLWWV